MRYVTPISLFRPASGSFPLCSILLATLLGSVVASPARAQFPGQNINMVSGTQWPGGDPFLQRQNEPSVALSSVNPNHLLAGSNDYRTVDLPFAPNELLPGALAAAGDAWIGIYKSLDGGLTWESTLLPGFPQDTSALGLASPLKGYEAAADPVIRAAPNGVFYVAGMAFDRSHDRGVVFVSRFVDLNNKEKGSVVANTDAIRYIDTIVLASGTADVFLDKPWLVVDLPRKNNTQCSIPGLATKVPVGPIYVAYAGIYDSGRTTMNAIRSDDCGATWGVNRGPNKGTDHDYGPDCVAANAGNGLGCAYGRTRDDWIAKHREADRELDRIAEISGATAVPGNGTTSTFNGGSLIGNASSLAVNPLTGEVYVAWRRFASPNQPDAIMFAYSKQFAEKWDAPFAFTGFLPFDQQTGTGAFRTASFPSIAVSVDSTNTTAINLVWSGRAVANGPARIMLARSTNNGKTWTAPVSIDPGPFTDDYGTSFSAGHQLMPSITFVGGVLSVAYYDSRFNQTSSLLRMNDPFVADAKGRFYKEALIAKGVGSSRVDLQACKLEYSIVSPK